MSLLTTVHGALTTNLKLNSLLARHKLAITKPAVYEQWAAEDTAKPYICLRYTFGDSYHWARSETLVNIDIFTDGDTVKAEAIRNQVIRILDKQTIADGDESDVRFFLENDAIIEEDNPSICHWNLEMKAIFWRQGFIEDYVNDNN
jgi:hypothetical protein